MDCERKYERFKNTVLRPGEVAQHTKALASKPDNLSQSSELGMKRKSQFPQVLT